MDNAHSKRYGALPVGSRQAGEVPGPAPQQGPPHDTGGHHAPMRGARLRRRREMATGRKGTTTTEETLRPLNILQWNAEGVYNKKLALTERLHAEKIDVACIQETHLNPNHRFTIRGYQTFRMDREGRHKGGVLILVKNNIPARDFQVDTNQQAEINGVKITVDSTVLTIFNLYCPPDKELSLQTLDIPAENCLAVGDFNSHSTCWGYDETDNRGEEVEDWQIDSKMILLNDPEDPPTFFSRRWVSSTTPDLAFATDDLSKKTTRGVQNQLGGSDHRPVKLAINLQYRPQDSKTFPRWNYKKANWDTFVSLSDQYTKGIRVADQNINRAIDAFNKAILKAASEAIPRGARKNYRPYWTEELQELEDEVSKIREKVENDPTIENNIALKESSAKYRKACNEAARKRWREKTEELNLDREGNKLWKLARAMNDEDTRSAPIVIQQAQDMLTGRKAANAFIDSYEEVSNITVPEEKKQQVHEERREFNQRKHQEEYMNKPFNMKEFEEAVKTLSQKKSPGPDKVTNEMLQHLGPRAKTKLLDLFNNSWNSGHVPQIWREADMVPVHKKGKDRAKVDSYRPISLTSCVGKLMERLINTRLSWHLEKNNILTPEQAGFRQHRSTEDQVAYIAQKIEDGYQDKKHTLTVWIDMEKAFDKVWKDGLRLKLQKCGVTGCMYQWISQYLKNRKARVHVGGTYSRKKTLREGVPQGGVLSPTLFLVFINDIIKDLPRNVQGAIYADDLVLWCTEEHLTTANYRLQEALNVLQDWTKRWLVKVNPKKTTYTIFSLSTREQKATLKFDGQILPLEDNPTYLGVTFDKRLTWKPQTKKVEARAKVRLAIMKKLAGTNWGADDRILKKLYTGRVRPVLEYGMTAWGTAAKSNFEKVSKVQNQAARLITGAMRSTPIQELETITGLESLEDRRDTKMLVQAAKFKRLPNHPMRNRLAQPTKGRLKRGSFIHQARILERKHRDILEHDLREIPLCRTNPAWNETAFPLIHCSIPGVSKKDSLDAVKKSCTMEYIHNNFPQDQWTHVFTDGSAEQAVKNGGAGIYIRYPGGREDRLSLATGLYSTNFKAEAVAIQTGATHVENSPDTSNNVVFFTDALSVLQALQTARDKKLNDLSTALSSLCGDCTVVLQWIPSHCGIFGNEAADTLAKEGSKKEQQDRSTTYSEVKSIIKAKQHNKWLQQHPRFNRNDPYYLLTRAEQVIIFRLRTGHNRLNYHLYTKLRIGQTDQCPCQTGSQTTAHLLQECPMHEELRHRIWTDETPVLRKLHGSLEDLRRTASFVQEFLSSGRVEYAGQPIGIIVADDPLTARSAASRVKVTYTNVQPPLLDTRTAINQKSFFPSQLDPVISGDPDTAIAQSARRLSGSVEVGDQYHFYMEAQSSRCAPNDNGGMDVQSTTQFIDRTTQAVAGLLNIPVNSVNLEVERLGGAFGGKITRNSLVAGACALAALIMQRPVRLVVDIHTNMKTMGKRLPVIGDYEVGFTEEGKLNGIKFAYYADCGHHDIDSGNVFVSKFIDNAYYCPNWNLKIVTVKTNKATNTALRAPEAVPCVYMMETIMEHIAKVLNKDPTEIKKLNLYQKGQFALNGTKLDYCNLTEIVSQIETSSDFEARKRQVAEFNQANRWRKRGISLIPARYGVAWTNGNYSVFVAVYHADGSVTVEHGGIDLGHGINTKVAQVCAYELGIPLSLVRVKKSSSNVNANSFLTAGSKTTEMNCQGVIQCCQEINARMAPVRQRMATAAWKDIVTECHRLRIDLVAHAFTVPQSVYPCRYDVYMAAVAEAELDVLTGQFQINRVDILYDCGDSMNPEIDVGQIEGGFVLGMGCHLTEYSKFDPKTGVLLTDGTWLYKPPLPKDLPIDFRVALLKNAPNPMGVLRSKTVGEPPVPMSCCTVFAIKHAVEAARAEIGHDTYFTLNSPALLQQVQAACQVDPAQFTLGN